MVYISNQFYRLAIRSLLTKIKYLLSVTYAQLCLNVQLIVIVLNYLFSKHWHIIFVEQSQLQLLVDS